MSLFALALSLLTTGCVVRQVSDSAPSPQAIGLHQWTSADAGFHTNSWWLDTGAEVIVFDAQFTPELAQALLAEIQATTDSPVTTVVVTHPNPDKFNGATVFQSAGARVVASQATADALPGVHAYKEAYFTAVGTFAPDAYPSLPTVDQTFDGELTLTLQGSDTPLILRELEQSGVASTQTVAIHGSEVFVGDLVASGTHAWLEGGIVDGVASPDLDSWDAALTELLDLVGEDARIHPGRGPSQTAGQVLPAQQAYLKTAHATVQEVLAEQEDPAQALAGEDASAVYAEITTRLEIAYPEYAHPYLVTYGVYGLAWSLL